ncbi:MAG TPA: SDR family oxidoreductase [Xanthomonadales bacterium]|nr:SDR family oxidoreductase [Xanthomonadales bacterium]
MNVIITGAGSGLGAAMARRFAAADYNVAVTDIDEPRARELLAEFKTPAARSFSFRLDTTCDSDWEALYQEVKQRWGGVDVLVNNAGVAAAGLCEETSLEDWQWVLDVDLMGVVQGCHRFVPMFRQQAEQGRKAHIVNIASFAGLSGMPGISAYGTAKAGVVALSEHLRSELKEQGIGVTVVCPAFVKTRLLETFRFQHPAQKDRVQRWMEHSGVTADDVARDVMKAIRKNRFLLLTHPSTRWAWLLKRWWPERYYREVAKQSRLTGRKAA